MAFTVGENVGPYRITDRLGQGGMATVYKAYHANLDRYVAIKVLHTAFKEDPTFLARFQREAQIIAKLEHPSIVPIYDYSEHEGEPYLVMKFIEGETLKGRLQQRPFTLEETLNTMNAVAQALTYAHERGVLHRDIKPSNILMEKGVTPYLADFGLARIASAGESTLSQDMMLGTPQYISPEQAQGVKDLDGTTDLYSLGVVLYELVVGRVPFNADTPYAIVHDHIYTPLPMPTKVNPQVPASVERVLLKALAKDRQDRYRTPVIMIEAFREAVESANMKELPSGSYRVPENFQFTPPSAVVPGLTGSASVPPAVGIPSPFTTSNPMSVTGSTGQMTSSPTSSAIARRERQRRRENLWVLGGFGLLVLTCLAALFIAISTYNTANQAGLFLAQAGPSNTRKPTLAATQDAASATTVGTQTEVGTIEVTRTSTSPNVTTNPTITTDAENSNTQVAATAIATEFATTIHSGVTKISVMSVDDAQQLVNANPDDPRARFILAYAYATDNRLPKAQTEFQEGLRLLHGDGTLAMELARETIPIAPEAWPVYLYTYAYDAGKDKDAAIRDEAGNYLYQWAQSVKKRDVLAINRIAERFKESQSAGVAAFIALAYNTVGMNSESDDAMYRATFINGDMPEVRLVQGVIELSKNASRAKTDLKAAATDGAPTWVLDEVKRLLS